MRCAQELKQYQEEIRELEAQRKVRQDEQSGRYLMEDGGFW